MNELLQGAGDAPDASAPSWRPLGSRQRRVVGVLIEKAKTTSDAYPLTLNALTNGCNQKSNRSPQMNLRPDDVEQVLDELREIGAVTEVQSSGRVAKYRHHMYEWLGVDKVELAVMAELLLRGEQTIGELRTRASRMEHIAGLPELKPILQSLTEKKLVLALTPEGRGQIVTHGLYRPKEMEQLKSSIVASVPSGQGEEGDRGGATRHRRAPASPAPGVSQDSFDALQSEVQQLREDIDNLRMKLERFEQLLQ